MTKEHEKETPDRACCETSSRERDRLARILDLLPWYVALVNGEGGVIYHNKTFEQYFSASDASFAEQRTRGPIAREGLSSGKARLRNTQITEWKHPQSGHVFQEYAYLFPEESEEPRVLRMGQDSTASVRVRQALDLSEQSYRIITDNLSIGIALLDPQLRIKAGNIRLSQWFGEGFRLDRNICELLQCGDRPAGTAEKGVCPDCPFTASLRDGKSHEKEFAATFQDGQERILRLITCPVKPRKQRAGNSNGVRTLIMMLEDITTRLRVNRQLQKARKLESMNSLAAGIAHEINQPLSALHLYAGGLQMLLEKPESPSPEVMRERLSLIMREADKIRSIITHMRSLVMREDSVPLASVRIADAVRAVLDLMAHQFVSGGVRIITDIPANLPPVRSNRVQLEQVLVNLMTNAMHALHNGSRERNASTSIIRVRAYPRKDGNMVRLEVADSGPGLRPGSEHIFDPFYTTKERHEGMGLGLSIAHGLVSLWGGEISALSRDPELGGAAFYVDLPAAEPVNGTGGDEAPSEPKGGS